jgi:hypothetical protein
MRRIERWFWRIALHAPSSGFCCASHRTCLPQAGNQGEVLDTIPNPGSSALLVFSNMPARVSYGLRALWNASERVQWSYSPAVTVRNASAFISHLILQIAGLTISPVLWMWRLSSNSGSGLSPMESNIPIWSFLIRGKYLSMLIRSSCWERKMRQVLEHADQIIVLGEKDKEQTEMEQACACPGQHSRRALVGPPEPSPTLPGRAGRGGAESVLRTWPLSRNRPSVGLVLI